MRALSKVALCGLGAGLFVLALGAALVSLEYSTAWLVRGPDEAARKAPQEAFTIGAARWTLEAYADSAELEAFRSSFESSCRAHQEEEDPIAAALCVSDRMAREFEHGQPETEFFAPSFDPEHEHARHRSGAPGHCVCRSAMMAAELLSVGIPARVVQLLPLDGSDGHNLVEVWETERGWVLVDPTYGGLVGEDRTIGSALDLAYSSRAPFERVGHAPVPFDAFTADEVEAVYDSLLPAAVVYPEPWLYLRVGDKSAPWPFRGRYVQVGPGAFRLGPAQRALAVALVVALALSAMIWLRFLVLLVKRGSPEVSRSL